MALEDKATVIYQQQLEGSLVQSGFLDANS